MSIETRTQLIQNPKLSFTDETQESDLLNPDLTNTWLIQMLSTLLEDSLEPIMITAVRSDHPTSDSSWSHSGGLAVDCYPKNWQGREQEAVVNVFRALVKNPYLWAVGLGGITQQWQTYVTWPTENFVIFEDNAADHLHIGAAMNGGGPGQAR